MSPTRRFGQTRMSAPPLDRHTRALHLVKTILTTTPLTTTRPVHYPNTLCQWKDRVHVITSIDGLRRALSASKSPPSEASRIIVTGLSAIDALLPGGKFATGAVHEILSGTETPPFLLPILIARSASRFGRIVWCDGLRQLHPPAVAALGLSLDRLVVLRPPSVADELWAVAECLRCKGVAACVAPLSRLSRVQARRLQLAAERGGGIGLVLRPVDAVSWPYAANTRWLVRPMPGERTVQRMSIELVHGHGGRVGNVLVELCRETHHVRAFAEMAHRPDQAQTAPASA